MDSSPHKGLEDSAQHGAVRAWAKLESDASEFGVFASRVEFDVAGRRGELRLSRSTVTPRISRMCGSVSAVLRAGAM